MAWEDATIEWLDDENLEVIAEEASVDPENLKKAKDWAERNANRVLVHHGPGWMQMLFIGLISVPVVEAGESNSYYGDHDAWSNQPMASNADWSIFDQ